MQHQPTRRTIGSLTDGTTHAIVFSELVVSGAANINLIRGAYALSVNTHGWNDRLDGGAELQPQGCLERVDAARKGYTGSVQMGGHFGTRWGDGSGPATFATILPPNSPSCFASGLDYSGRAMVSASSFHTGGVNVSLADGSCRFVSDSVNALSAGASTESTPVRSGASPYGVWGAYGSINGGESLSL